MSFRNTEPVPLLSEEEEGQWRRFRVADPDRQRSLLHKISRGDMPVSLGRPPSALLSVSLWSVDASAGLLHFSAPITPQNEQAIGALVVQPDTWAAAYVGEEKIQFRVRGLGAVMKGGRMMLSAEGPLAVYRLTRRHDVRVHFPADQAPVARLWAPADLPAMPADRAAPTALGPSQAPGAGRLARLANVSLQGCALRLPASHPAPKPGQLLRQVEVELDEETLLYADLVVQHVTPDLREPGAHLVGCMWGHMPSAARALLQKWIANGRRRLDLVSLNFD